MPMHLLSVCQYVGTSHYGSNLFDNAFINGIVRAVTLYPRVSERVSGASGIKAERVERAKS